MAFFKKRKKKINGKWYPQSVTAGKTSSTGGGEEAPDLSEAPDPGI